MTRWIKIPGPGQFRGEGRWTSLEDCCYNVIGSANYKELLEQTWEINRKLLPTREQETKPEESER
jgi:hypothetical protein